MASAFSIWMFSTHFSHEGCTFHFSLVGVTIDRAIPAVMDAASISSYSLAQLVYFLWLIARELCNRFGAPIENTPASASSGVQPPPVLETAHFIANTAVRGVLAVNQVIVAIAVLSIKTVETDQHAA